MGEWRRPSACSTTSCIEVINHGKAIEIRNSQFDDGHFGCLASPDEWAAFVAAVKAGEFFDDLG